MNPQRLNSVRMQFAEFLLNQFGVQTMAQWGWRFGRMETDDTKADESGTYALHTLKENETIARLASGIKRFTLPDEFNYIKIFQTDRREPPQAAAGRCTHWSIWPKSSRTGGSTPRRPIIGSGCLKDFPNAGSEPPPGLAAAARPDRRQLGPLRAGHDPARRPRGHRRVPLPQRTPDRLYGPRDQGREAAGRREGVSQVESPQSRLGENQHRRYRLSPGAKEPETVHGPRGGPVADAGRAAGRTISTSG